ncbi:MAG: DUF3164 family protein [Bacteroidetes bacterium]|nr:MAG: DUF3164 family protein [Bacteroidota bacterium]
MSKKEWRDEQGLLIPANRVTKSEKLRERSSEKLLKQAKKVSGDIDKLKDLFADLSEEVMNAVMLENEIDNKKHKGNFTWYNFDRSIKIEVAISERIEFDDMLIAAAKEKFDEFLSDATGGVEDMIRELILDAFHNTKGRLDSKRVLGLVRYSSKVPKKTYPKFHDAVQLIQDSIRKPFSKKYFRIFEKNADGEYESINLNISAA